MDVYINYQQLRNSNGFYSHKSCFANFFKGAISENKAVLRCKGYDYEESADEIMDAPLGQPFF